MRINARLSGSMLRVTTLRGGGFPPKGTPTEESGKRAKRHLRDKCDALLVFANQHTRHVLNGWGLRFLTLTFRSSPGFDAGGLEMYDLVHRSLKHFIARLRLATGKTWGKDIAYICVPELGKEHGRFHFHLLIFSPFFRAKELESTWGQGTIDIQRVYDKNPDEINNLYAYLIKYMGKSIDAPSCYVPGKKRYHSSRNIRRMVCNVKCILDDYSDVPLLIKSIAANCGVCGVWTWSNDDITLDTVSIPPTSESISKAVDVLKSCI